MGQSEIQSSIIGKKVMEELKELDKLLILGFPVYTEFGEYIDDYMANQKEIKLKQTLRKF